MNMFFEKIRKALVRAEIKVLNVKNEGVKALTNNKGALTDKAIEMIIGIVIGGLLLGFLTFLFKDEIFTGIEKAIDEMFKS